MVVQWTADNLKAIGWTKFFRLRDRFYIFGPTIGIESKHGLQQRTNAIRRIDNDLSNTGLKLSVILC